MKVFRNAVDFIRKEITDRENELERVPCLPLLPNLSRPALLFGQGGLARLPAAGHVIPGGLVVLQGSQLSKGFAYIPSHGICDESPWTGSLPWDRSRTGPSDQALSLSRKLRKVLRSDLPGRRAWGKERRLSPSERVLFPASPGACQRCLHSQPELLPPIP